MALLGLLLPGAHLGPPRWRLLGLLPLAAGIALNLLADRAFKAAGTTVKPLLESTALVTDGVFRLTRNPMYLGFLLLLLGLWILLGVATPGLVLAPFAVLIDRAFIAPEEEKLARTFGGPYAAYRHRVRRWL
jgi:protein-S-isoprenylcysteine O-methyltransferase Ste14